MANRCAIKSYWWYSLISSFLFARFVIRPRISAWAGNVSRFIHLLYYLKYKSCQTNDIPVTSV